MDQESKLHPSVLQFKQFVNSNPYLIKKVRTGDYDWQELFEEWYLLGEDDPRWDEAKDEEGAKESGAKTKNPLITKDKANQVIAFLKRLDPEQINSHIDNFSKTIGAIQTMIGQFQGEQTTSQQSKQSKQSKQPNPFQFRKD